MAARDAPDSQNVLPALLGKSKIGRTHLVEQASALALRQGQWKYIEPSRGPKKNMNTNTELGNDPAGQLYNLADDLGETQNVAVKYPRKVKEMDALLRKIKEQGTSMIDRQRM